MDTVIKKDFKKLAFALVLVVGLGISGGFSQALSGEENIAAAGTNPDARLGGENVPFSGATSTAEVVSLETAIAPIAPKVVGGLELLSAALETCDTDGTGGCKNLCSTSYVIPTLSGGYITKDCYVSVNKNPPMEVVYRLQACIEKETGTKVPDDEFGAALGEPIKQALCIGDMPSLSLGACSGASCDGVNPILDKETREKKDRLLVPKACESELEAVIKLRQPSSAKTSATAQEGALCVSKGPVVCYPKDFARPSLGYTCIYKQVSGLKIPASLSGSVSSSAGKCDQDGFFARTQCQLGSMFNGISNSGVGVAIGQALGKYIFQGENTSNSNQQCPSGYTQTSEGTQTICTKKSTAATAQCLLVASDYSIASGDRVTVRWRTANATDIDIDGIGNNVSANDEMVLQPTQSTTYSLVATGSGTDNAKTCEITVTVDDNAVNPVLSCLPDVISPGELSTVTWACPATADTSVGIGIDTEGALSGNIAVSPDHNSEYSVTCLNGTEVVGQNSCSISIANPVFDIIAQPTEVKRGERVRISWASLFMTSCRVQGPRGFDYTNKEGVVLTEPFSLSEETLPDSQVRSAIYTIECDQQTGGVITKEVVVELDEE